MRGRHPKPRRSVRPLAFAAALLAAATFPACGPKPKQEAPPGAEPAAIRFADVTAAAGFTHVHRKPRLDPKLDNIREWVSSVGAAAAAGDYDRDGLIDLYVTTSDKGAPNLLYRNRGDGTFVDVAAEAGVADVNDDGGTSMDCVFADYDNDGWSDLYVVRWGRDRLFRNLGNGRFEETTERCFTRKDGAPGTDWANGNAAVFFDYDLDGRLDIYVGNYFQDVDLWNLKSTRIMHGDFENARDGGVNFLYHQQEDGRFREVAANFGVDDCGWTLDVGSADVNNDGRPDLYVANDFGPDQLFVNDPVLGFDNVSESALGFDTKKGMNIDFGDFDNDGWLDAYVTNITTAEYLQEGNMLWHNEGPGDFGLIEFADVSERAGAWDGGWAWGAKFFDADSDGDLDIVSMNGFISGGEGDYWYDLASWTVLDKDPAEARNWPAIEGRSFSGHEKKRFWRSDGPLRFHEVSQDVGLTTTADGRGVVTFDADNDGDLDLYFANQGAAPNYYRNDTDGGHWLMVSLAAHPDAKGNRDAIGARVTLVTEHGAQIRERDGGNGYCGGGDPRLHFGLGGAANIRFVEVRWPDETYQVVREPRVDQVLEIRQDPAAVSPRSEIAVAAPTRLRLAPASPAPEATLSEAELAAKLESLEGRLRNSIESYASGAFYRALCATHGQHDRAIAFFDELVHERPDDSRARIELALAYVDKIPTCGGLAAIVSKGTLARRSLDQLDRVLAEEGDSWKVRYCRGMNHLHWPRALRHSDDAAADFARCVELQQADPDPAKPHFERTYLGLGDALVKDGHATRAREAWRQGLARFPNSAELAERLRDRTDAELLDLVEERRSLENPIDTNLSFLDP